ncbi:Chloroperoxidase [Ilyonectria robusta]|uniref:Chloroperoxidase n=1 Tax=Ilyonectria robusta TaxID=1079257 RepID=UPI001E8D0C7F|nr:Chloroperoxidase [Ilyonectria robusta]KAH8664757.1 Chloroperoxidase [Ilyonectria robusta]
MLFNVVFCLSAALAASASNEWQAATENDRRSPCPMVNSLANHGYLPRDGLNISLPDLIVAFTDALNLDPAATTLVGQKALLSGNNVTFDLDNLDKHGILEHDGSLSRNDVYFGDNHSFNETIWESVASHFNQSTISIQTAATARKERIQAAAAVNPAFAMSASDVQFSFIETALYLSIFGSVADGNAVTEWVRIMFQEERLPFQEGFTTSEDVITAAGILGLVAKVAAASA